MHKLALTVMSLLTLQSLWSPAMSEGTPLVPNEDKMQSGILNGRATIKIVGPLHLSEGIVVMKDNEISVLSDATDSIREAELSGQLIHAHAVGDRPSRIIKGLAIFTGGYSIKALDGHGVNESIAVTDGSKYLGHIIDSSTNLLRIKTASGVIVVPIRNIAEISSPRAFEFSITANDEQPSASDSVASAQNRIAFDPTLNSDPNNISNYLHASTVHKQLSENHLKKRVLTTGLVVTGAAACIAVPFGCALFTQRPNR